MGFLSGTTPPAPSPTVDAPVEREPSRWAEMLGATPPPVEDSPDLRRIVALPRRDVPSLDEQLSMAEEMTRRLELHTRPCSCPIHTLLPVQGWYLHEAARVCGALGLLSAGAGKTGIGLLLSMVLPNVKTAVLLVPPELRVQMIADALKWERHFRLPNIAWTAATRAYTGGDIDAWQSRPFHADRPTLYVMAYSEISSPKFAAWFRAHDPDVVIADETQCLSARKSTRTDRFLRFVAERARAGRRVRMACHSGSLTTRSITQYQHLAAVALGEHSPVPLSPEVAAEWGTALDPALRSNPAQPGALVALGAGDVRAAYASRMLETEGVISTIDAAVPVPLTITMAEMPPAHESVAAALRVLRTRAERPDGEQLVDAAQIAACARQLAFGFFYRWVFPRGESPELVQRWRDARSAWFAELRRHLSGTRRDGMDSPGLLAAAAERELDPHYRGEEPTWASRTWAAWCVVRDAVHPETEPVWLDDGVVRWAAAWGAVSPGTVWVTHRAVGERLAEVTGWRYYTGGVRDERDVADDDGSKTAIMSVKAMGTGKNLQAWHRGLLLGSISDAGAYEQLLARHHRPQQAHAVTFELVMHTPELRRALTDATERARYVAQTTRQSQRLLVGLGIDTAPGAF